MLTSPYQEMARVGGNLRFYLDQAGTINITVRNQSNTQIQFSAQVKDCNRLRTPRGFSLII